MVRIRHTRVGGTRLAVCAVVALAVFAAGHLANAQASRDSKSDLRSLEKKVDDALANQQLILKKLEDVLEELRIVKVRATQS